MATYLYSLHLPYRCNTYSYPQTTIFGRERVKYNSGMKQMSFNKVFTVEKKGSEYGDLIKRTSILIERPYMQTFKLVEKLEPSQVLFLYENSIKKWRELKFKSASMMWWTERKKLSTPPTRQI